jgi:hypothetical protein
MPVCLTLLEQVYILWLSMNFRIQSLAFDGELEPIALQGLLSLQPGAGAESSVPLVLSLPASSVLLSYVLSIVPLSPGFQFLELSGYQLSQTSSHQELFSL